MWAGAHRADCCNVLLLLVYFHYCRLRRYVRAQSRSGWCLPYVCIIRIARSYAVACLSLCLQAVQIFKSPVALGLVRTQHRTLYATNIGMSRCALRTDTASLQIMQDTLCPCRDDSIWYCQHSVLQCITA
jgi:hypothetical protein